MGQNETPNTTDCTVQEFDFTGTHDENELAAIVEDLSSEEAAAALAAIRDVREEQADRKVQNFKNWFDAAFLPILKDFAEITGSRLKIQQDPWHDITATFSSQCGIDITPSEKRMRMVISAAGHISINKQTDSDRVDFSLIFGFPDDAE